jgi:4-amino-4-deoxy-L-arabinose transferase-like glycosyltransferase
MADWLAAGRFHDALSVAYHPLYPLLIAAAGHVAGGTEPAGSAVSVILGSAATVPLFFTVRAIFGRPPAFFAALLYAFSPDLVEVQSEAMTEGAYMFFLFSSIWLTWRMMEAPSLERGAVLGAAAAATFLVRPEGLLAVGMAMVWPLVRRDRLLPRFGGALTALAVILVLVAPYLLWVKAERGRWGLSVRPSVISAERAIAGAEEQDPGTKSRLYGIYFHSMFRTTAVGVLIPFHLLGLASLRGIAFRKALFYLSFPLGLLGGTLYVLRTHNFMSGRYVLAAMTLLNGLAGVGLTAVISAVARRWPAFRWREAAAACVLVIAVLPGASALRLRRQELRSARTAAEWIRSQGPPPRAMSGPFTQVAYLAGARSVYSGLTSESLREQILGREVEYYAYTEKDVERRPAYIALLRSCELLQPPVEIQGPPGTVRVYLQRVR